METKVNIEGQEYEINLDRAKELGVIKEARKPITDIKTGDLFYSKLNGNMIVIQQSQWQADEYIFSGSVDTLYPYNQPWPSKSMSKKNVINWFNTNDPDRVFVGNINDQVREIIKSYYPKK
jgi:ABC-type molybdate transport system substrate-binding protein